MQVFRQKQCSAMGKSERLGQGICVAVLTIYLVQVASLIIWWDLITSRDFGVLTSLVSGMVALATIVYWFWKGEPFAGRASCVLLVLLGVALISIGYWLTTLEFPNAVSAEERVRMQGDCRR